MRYAVYKFKATSVLCSIRPYFFLLHPHMLIAPDQYHCKDLRILNVYGPGVLQEALIDFATDLEPNSEALID